MLLWVQYHVNNCGGAIAVVALWACCVGCSTILILVVALYRLLQYGVFCWVQYQVNASGGPVAVGAVWVCCCGCSTSLIIVVAL